MLTALLSGERLAERLLQVAVDSGITAPERNQRLQALQAELIRLRYDEEVAICLALERGDDVVRSSSPPWAVLMIEVEHRQAVAA